MKYLSEFVPDVLNTSWKVPLVMMRGIGMLESAQLLECYARFFETMSVTVHRIMGHYEGCSRATTQRESDIRAAASILLGVCKIDGRDPPTFEEAIHDMAG